MIKDFTHPILGAIVPKINSRARRVILRTKNDTIQVTVPPIVTKEELIKILDKHVHTLQAQREHKPQLPTIDEAYVYASHLLSFYFKRHSKSAVQLHTTHNGAYTVLIPEAFDFASKNAPITIRHAIRFMIKHEAQRVLPLKLRELALKHNIAIADVRINSSVGRWGSCNSKRNINLSCNMILLPPHLIEYVMLHELAHTFEMNHSERFYAKLDQLTHGNHARYQKELKAFSSELISYLRG